VRQYEQRHRVRSDPDFKHTLNPEMFRDTPTEKERYRELKKRPPVWKRPRAEAVAKAMDLEFLYKYGYDYGSLHVHPMANDGDEDFRRLTGLDQGEREFDQSVVLNNSCLTLSLLIQEGLNTGTLEWRAVVYDFLNHFIALLGSGSQEYKTTLAKMIAMRERAGLCRKRTDK